MALRRILMRHPCASSHWVRTLRTQASPDEEEGASAPTKRGVSRFKGRTVREIIRYSEPDFDAAAATQQAVRTLTQLHALLERRPRRVMDVAELAALHPNLRVRDHPGVFQVIHSSLVCFTPEAEAILKQEETEARSSCVRALRKLLMLSGEKRLPIPSVDLLAPELGVASGVSDLVSRNPQFFQVFTTLDCTTWVRLKLWDPELAVSYAEIQDKQRQAGAMTEMEMWTPKGYVLSKRHRKVLARFREAPFVSPYADFRDLESLKMKLERHAVAGMQELLSLTVYKSLVLGVLAEFPTEFSFSRKPLDLALRHPECFYVSPVGNQQTIFLRSAYRSGALAEKTPLILLRDQLGKLLQN